ncbi:MAG: FadR family transcriptional regulator [Spirochaetia bacterium]|jgi:GntR family transcriptional repressor for pyruvate dehydrogenase complex|nr:FadR family transcriptional regulator [Spirochaetia bacterium]
MIVEKIGASEQVFVKLNGDIRNRKYLPDEKLPTEADLAEKYGVSRNSVRSAINKLATLGLVETFQGKGTFVKDADFSSRVENLVPQIFRDTNDYLSLMYLRIAIEAQSAALAALSATYEDIQALEAIVVDLENHTEDLHYCALHDIEYHMKIAEIGRNSLIVTLVRMIRDILNDILMDFIMDYGTYESVISHRKILDAIKSANPLMARDAMWHHLQTVIDRYSLAANRNRTADPAKPG